ncbi:MAG TPA: ABC transporter permease, partial [Gemmatimonadales bacterium]|nr:ABC transporter permease [Gemmatimonadales bacterium]
MNLAIALRTLRRSPRYAVTVALTLAAGIAATAATFSVFRSVVLAPVPYAPADRAMTVFERDTAGTFRLASYPTFRDWRAGTEVFEGLAFVRGVGQVMKTERGGERLLGAFVTEDFFHALPGEIALGRTFGPDDHRSGAPATAVLTHRVWRRAFGGDPAVVGRSIVLGERSYTVIGVLAPSFGYPIWADFFSPLGVIAATDPALAARGLHVDSRVVGRLRPGVDSATAARALGVVAARLAEAYPAESGGYRAVAMAPIAAEILGGTGPQLRLL